MKKTKIGGTAITKHQKTYETFSSSIGVCVYIFRPLNTVSHVYPRMDNDDVSKQVELLSPPLKSNQAKLSVSVCARVCYIFSQLHLLIPIQHRIKTFIFSLLKNNPPKTYLQPSLRRQNEYRSI